MQPWVSQSEAETLVEGYPVTIPDSFDKWVNQAFILISKNTAYSFPTDPTEDMKLALSLYACILGSGETGSADLKSQGVTSFSIGNFSQSYSDKLLTGLDQYPEPVKSLLAQYRTGRNVIAKLTRTYPRN